MLHAEKMQSTQRWIESIEVPSSFAGCERRGRGNSKTYGNHHPLLRRTPPAQSRWSPVFSIQLLDLYISSPRSTPVRCFSSSLEARCAQVRNWFTYVWYTPICGQRQQRTGVLRGEKIQSVQIRVGPCTSQAAAPAARGRGGDVVFHMLFNLPSPAACIGRCRSGTPYSQSNFRRSAFPPRVAPPSAASPPRCDGCVMFCRNWSRSRL